MTSQRRVCITGIGVITPLGNDPDSLWKNISAGNSGITLNEDLPESVPSRIWGQPEPISLDGFAPSIMMPLKKSDRFIQYGAYAARQAMLDAYGQDKLPDDLSLRCGVAIGSGIGGLDRIIEQYEFMKEKNRTSPFFISSTIINEVAGVVSIVSNARGPNFSLVSACATGAHNIGHAARAIQYGEADIMLAGGSEALLGPLAFFGFSANRALSRRNDDPQGASRPWDADRDGFVMSNGAGVVVLEELTMARNRGADIYAEVIGYGMSGDAHHITAPREDGDGMIRCMNASLADAGLAPEDILYINAHATSTPLGDSIESRAVGAGLWRSCAEVVPERQQIHDRPYAGGRRQCGSHIDRTGPAQSESATDHQSGPARSRLPSWTMCPDKVVYCLSVTQYPIPLALEAPMSVWSFKKEISSRGSDGNRCMHLIGAFAITDVTDGIGSFRHRYSGRFAVGCRHDDAVRPQ